MQRKRLLGSIGFLLLLSLNFLSVSAQDNPKPFILPIAAPSSPSTWLFIQPYGNTVGAYNFGTAWYSAGQGLHFGVDLGMPCGTPVVAVADGDVVYADNLAFGAGPHNVILRFPDLGLTALYGHLLNPPPVQQYQHVHQGDVIGNSGDPDLTCDSRPHLHFEVRSLDYRTAYNPIDYVQANWDVLAAIGSFDRAPFELDLTNPRQWVSLHDQPPVAFGGRRLNAYPQAWPPDESPPGSAAPTRPFTPLPADAVWQLRPLSTEGCCASFWWNRAAPTHLDAIDGSPGQQAGILEWDAPSATLLNVVGQAPPPFLSPDGTYQIIAGDGQASIRRLSDGLEWNVPTNGFLPAISTDNSNLLWIVQYGQAVPGATPPQVEIWVSDLNGNGARMILSGTRISASWLDGSRLLISQADHTLTTLSVFNTIDSTTYTLGTWDRLRGLSVAPGGGRVLFYQTFQSDATANAVYALETQAGAIPQKLPWFGSWRWRDSESVYYIPFQPDNAVQTLAYYHIPSGENRFLTDPSTLPFTTANGSWAVSGDGRHIAFQSLADQRLWLLDTGS